MGHPVEIWIMIQDCKIGTMDDEIRELKHKTEETDYEKILRNFKLIMITAKRYMKRLNSRKTA